MTRSESQKVIDEVIKGIAVFSNLEASEIGVDDNLEEDLFLNIKTDLPAIISSVSKELDIEIQREIIADFIKTVLDDPEEAMVSSLVAFFEEEVEFN
jgi:PII-like signaling protein